MFLLEQLEAACYLLVGVDEVVGEEALNGRNDGCVYFGCFAAEYDYHDKQIVRGLYPAINFLRQKI